LAFLNFLDVAGVERAGLVTSVSPEVIGHTAEVNDWNARYCAAEPGRLIAFRSVHPNYVSNAAPAVDRLASIGIRALKVHPPHQLFAPNAHRDGLESLTAVYARAQDLGLPVMIHTGTSVFPGARIVYAWPMLADDIGVHYPDLVVILVHADHPQGNPSSIQWNPPQSNRTGNRWPFTMGQPAVNPTGARSDCGACTERATDRRE